MTEALPIHAQVAIVGGGIGSWQNMHVGYAPVRGRRISYVGELGWELHVPSEFAQQVFETIMATPNAPRPCAGMTVDSCRIEKGCRHWGHDIGPHDSPVESDLTFACDFDTEALVFAKNQSCATARSSTGRRLQVAAGPWARPLAWATSPGQNACR